MLLQELETTYIEPLARGEKWRLISDIQRMLQEEERREEQQALHEIFTPGKVYELATLGYTAETMNPLDTAHLQELLEGQPV